MIVKNPFPNSADLAEESFMLPVKENDPPLGESDSCIAQHGLRAFYNKSRHTWTSTNICMIRIYQLQRLTIDTVFNHMIIIGQCNQDSRSKILVKEFIPRY